MMPTTVNATELQSAMNQRISRHGISINHSLMCGSTKLAVPVGKEIQRPPDSGDTYWNDRAGWQPIGRGVFSGTRPEFLFTFDGGDHTIANLYMNRGDYVGLFGSIGASAEIRDVVLTDVNVTGSEFGEWVGGLVGSDGGSISDSYATGTVSGANGVGGLAGHNGGSISDSYATGAVTGNTHVGGLVGSGSGSISGSYAKGAVTGSDYNVGGLVGLGSGSISGSYATGTVDSNGYQVGGLVGYTSGGNISASYATGMVTGDTTVGGLVGWYNHSGSISSSYATGTVTADATVGGLVGYNRNGNISSSYAIGRVLGANEVGGLVGKNEGAVTDSYWDTVASGRSHSDGGVGKTTAELQSPIGYTGIYAAWDVDLDNADRDRDLSTGGDDPWDFGTSSQYPALQYGGLDVSAQRGGQTQTPAPPTEDPPLDPPTNVRVNPVGSGLVNVGWDRVPSAAGYTIVAVNIANPAEGRTKSVNNPDAVAGQIGNLTIGEQYNIYVGSFDANLDFALDFSEKKRVTVE